MADKKILIGMPCQSGVVPVPTVQSLLMLHKPLTCGFSVIERQRIDKARNMMAMECLVGGFDYLFFIDDDNPIPPETLELFLEDDKDIVTAPILARNPVNNKHPLCAFYAEKIKTEKGEINIYFPIEKFKDKGHLHRVDATGTGCILIKRKVLEALNKKYQDYMFEFGDMRFPEVEYKGTKYTRRTMSEDCEFSERAVEAGFEIWLDDRIKPIHLTGMGSVRYDG